MNKFYDLLMVITRENILFVYYSKFLFNLMIKWYELVIFFIICIFFLNLGIYDPEYATTDKRD